MSWVQILTRAPTGVLNQRPSIMNIVQFQKISILPQQKGLEFPVGRGSKCKTKKYTEIYEA